MIKFNMSVLVIIVDKEVTSNDTIASSSSMEPFLMQLENMVEFLAIIFSSLI